MNGNHRISGENDYAGEGPARHATRPTFDPPARTIPGNSTVNTQALGEPLSIEQVAQLLGCSPWTVRQRYLRQGLPYLQASRRGKLVFFREQVIGWIQKRQRQKGGVIR